MFDGSPSHQESFNVFGDDITLDVHDFSWAYAAKSRCTARVRDDGNGKCLADNAHNGETHTIDTNRALVDHVPDERRIDLNDQHTCNAVLAHLAHAACPVDMPGDDMPTKAPAGRHGALDVNCVSSLQATKVGSAQGLRHSRDEEMISLHALDRETDAIDGNAIPQLHVFHDFVSCQFKRGA